MASGQSTAAAHDPLEISAVIDAWITKHETEFSACSQFLFDNPELGMQEHKASALLADIAASHGFSVERGVAGMATAFAATWGSGSPVLGFSVEYDALPGLSQQVCAEKKPVAEGGPGHGCGHCALGPGALQAAMALRYAMEAFSLAGTVRIFGTPAEEACVGKAFMARAGIFKGVDCFLDWHPNTDSSFIPKGGNAYFNKYYHFKGLAAHGNAPWKGRSSLDAAMLMGHAVELLREHIRPGKDGVANTINYTFSDVGPEYPGVIPDRSSLWFVGRFTSMEILVDAMERIDNCARGSALATGTEVHMELVTAIHDKLPNDTLAEVLHAAFLEVGSMPVTEEEQEFAKTMQKNAGYKAVGVQQKIS